MKKTILVTGSNGLLGQKTVYGLLVLPDVHCVSTGRGPNRMKRKDGYEYEEFDITDYSRMEELFEKHRPDAVIHTAALTNVDACENRREEAYALNVEAVKSLASVCGKNNTHLVHLSTDFVFDGSEGPYIESDQVNPISYYAQTKSEAEIVVKESRASFSIIRTIIIYGVVDDNSRSNVVLWTINSLREKKIIRVINDQHRSPTLAEDLAQACISAALRREKGLFHVSGRELMCIEDIVRITADYFDLDDKFIQPISSEELHQPAKRPPMTGFLIQKAEQELGFHPRPFLEGLAIVKKQLLLVG
ncbi:MAG: SDR family NAD(P)-dependent oxidoreductase [Bacteroidetes bacterium]|nr:MAG: SDR family NAD(P)-dependent oxidoreductase [Bacteroidota bacterium]REK05363.1 MAG: SDR family NAD(P)-dependent oxidoreductase [Bacteroidota bacterium]REK32737.1 MAG: SDR family NAD(P)-dependent oxidoreductase [Bacteroidota bacterium]REK49068.1 MAG: SDR family NAD(P)-dependent oxidoreductase [Bacteroidota bacterium]